MTMSKNKKIDLSNFDFNDFKTEALSQLKSGQSLTGKDGILTPLMAPLQKIINLKNLKFWIDLNCIDQIVH